MKRATFIALPLLALLGIAGCSATPHSQPQAQDTSTPSAVVNIDGAGPQEKEVSIPSSARSVIVDVACTGGGVLTVTTNSDATRIGTCDGNSRFTVPTPKQQDLRLQLFVGDAVKLHATAEFNDDEVQPDAGLKAACSIVSAGEQARTDNNGSALRHAGTELATADVPTAVRNDIAEIAAEYKGDTTNGDGAHDRVNAACMNNDTPVTTSSSNGG